MHPAKSVILFTTASGAGAGLLVWLVVFGMAGRLPHDFLFQILALSLAFILVSVGLLSSLLHLGHPARAWRALSQWRSSWLSREGVAALTIYPTAGAYGIALYILGVSSPITWALSFATIVLTIAFLISTGMIYASLRPIRAWANPYVPTGYLLFALMTGAMLLTVVQSLFAEDHKPAMGITIGLLAIGLVHKWGYWRFIDDVPSSSTPETATSLSFLGRVRLLEGPHSEANYLMQEMGFRIARKHSRVLRCIVLIVGFILPSLILGVSLIFPSADVVLILLATFFCTVGIGVERWLFFAEAKHTVALYYGAPSA
ncbi:MAG: DmsC/YnfH family molybdoenzyme membrane anchor subunit [Alphaproteobacteria bacterium]